jgi:hypothetical protein
VRSCATPTARRSTRISCSPTTGRTQSEPDSTRASIDLSEQLDAEARRRGADFTRAETAAMLERAAPDIDGGRRPNIRMIIEGMAEDGTPLDDLDTRQGRQNWMVARLADAARRT